MKRQGASATFARHVGRLLAAARHGRGRRAEWVADRAGIDATTLRKLEAGHRLPRVETLVRIWLALGFSLDDLMLEAASESGVSAMGRSDEPGQGE